MGRIEIHGTKGKQLHGRRILIGVTGSIAAIEIPHLVREIIRYSGDPIVVLSEEATRFVTTDAITWCTDKEPYTKISGISEHIKWISHPEFKVDLYIMCPATANSMSKLAAGIADGPVTLSALAALGAGIPILIVPAAHSVLLENPITKRNITYLQSLNVHFMQRPEEEDKYKFPPLVELMNLIFKLIESSTGNKLRGKKFLVTGGATREYFDGVRFLSNPSTGLSALYVAQALEEQGASVKFILGEGNNLNIDEIAIPTVVVRSTEDMYITVRNELSNGYYDGFISVAAVSDYTPVYTAGKIPSRQSKLNIELVATTKIIEKIRQEFQNLYIVAYKAEVGLQKADLLKKGHDLLEKYDLGMVCANWVGEPEKGFASKTNEVFLIKRHGPEIHVKGTKIDLGREIAKVIAMQITESGDNP